MDSGKWISSIEICPIYSDTLESWRPEGEPERDAPEQNVPELWRLSKVALIQGVRRVPCWKCRFLVIQSGLFLELWGRYGYRCRIVPWSGVDDIGLLSQPFRRTLYADWCVCPHYSKAMKRSYLVVI